MLRTGQLKEHSTTAQEIDQLRAAIRRNRADAQVTAIRDETRFDAAYKAIMQPAMLALLVNGFRPSSSSGETAIVEGEALLNAVEKWTRAKGCANSGFA